MQFTNWREVLTNIIDERISLSTDEYEWIVSKALRWPECACGELCKALPRGRTGEPEDMILQHMGADFYTDIRSGRWSAALQKYNAIEARTALLLKPILQEAFLGFDPLQPKQNFIVEHQIQ